MLFGVSCFSPTLGNKEKIPFNRSVKRDFFCAVSVDLVLNIPQLPACPGIIQEKYQINSNGCVLACSVYNPAI